MVATVAVMGSTGSIGTQTLEVIARSSGFRVIAIGANRDIAGLARQAREVRPEVVALADADRAAELKELLPAEVSLEAGPDAMAAVVGSADIVVNGVVGFAGLPVTLETLRSGRRLALANKESLIAAGPLVAQVRSTPGAELIPVDSEHCALHQCLRSSNDTREIRALVLTASGGPFRARSPEELETVTVDDALSHPTWNMGPKITVDSSTLMNKGLEVIEAHELFGVSYDSIEVVVHPQSIVHSMATFSDGATIAQLSLPDMRLPIGYALSFPNRLDVPFGALDFSTALQLDFEPPDRGRFRSLDLAFAAGRAGATAPAWLSAANEIAVEAFLDGRLRWVDIATVLESALDEWPGTPARSVEDVLEVDRNARAVTRGLLEKSR